MTLSLPNARAWTRLPPLVPPAARARRVARPGSRAGVGRGLAFPPQNWLQHSCNNQRDSKFDIFLTRVIQPPKVAVYSNPFIRTKIRKLCGWVHKVVRTTELDLEYPKILPNDFLDLKTWFFIAQKFELLGATSGFFLPVQSKPACVSHSGGRQ